MSTNNLKLPDWFGIRLEGQSWRSLWSRFSFYLLILISAFFLLIAKADLRLIEFVTNRFQMVASPLMSFVQHPVDHLRLGADFVGEALALREQNSRLREENLVLRGWKARAVHLDVENRSIREQLKFPRTEETPDWVTAKVIGDSASSFVHTRLLALGARDGLEVGMAAVDENGLAGRIIRVGEFTSRLLLLTDFNSRIPVTIASSLDRAILSGDNSPRPRLEFLPLEPSYRIGDLVMTSGQGGMLPAGIPIGVISATIDDTAVVRPFADWSRLDYVTALVYRPLQPPEADGAPQISSRPDEEVTAPPSGNPS